MTDGQSFKILPYFTLKCMILKIILKEILFEVYRDNR